MIATLLRRLRMKREIAKSLRARKIVRMARAEAARRGISQHWKRAGTRTRELFRNTP